MPKKLGIDLIMIGATGLNAVERLLIGSVTEYVTRTAVCDVLVVRTDLENKPAKQPAKKAREISLIIIKRGCDISLLIQKPVVKNPRIFNYRLF